jgi:hypothetical protein
MTASRGVPVDRSGDRLDQARLVIVVVAVALLAVLTWSVFDSRDDADQAQQETATLAQQVTVACQAGGAAARELDAIGACQVAATAAIGAPTTGQAPVVQVATDGQVRAAVSEYLRINPPADGRTPSSAEVEVAVTRVCQAIGCQGQPGQDGQPGEPGDDGADASDAQVDAEVAAYCASNNGCLPSAEEIHAAVAAYCSADPSPCIGPVGAQGEQGQPGPVLPEYYETDGGLTRHCVLQPQEDAAEPPRYECTLETSR